MRALQVAKDIVSVADDAIIVVTVFEGHRLLNPDDIPK
jgi:hypothetical protein